MLLELKLMKYIIFTTEYKQDLVTDLVLCSACPMLLVDDLQRWAARTSLQSGCHRLRRARLQGKMLTAKRQLSSKMRARA
jgi:hypothetical protein